MKKLLLTAIVAFAFCGSVFAQTFVNPYGYETHWEFNEGQYADVDWPDVYIAINGEIISLDGNWADLEVASFVGNEIRGHAFLSSKYALEDWWPDNNPWAQVPVRFDSLSLGETVTFKVYDHSTGFEYDTDCNVSIHTGEEHTEISMWDSENTVVLNLTSKQVIQLTGGWNWVSVGVAVDEPINMLDMLKVSLGENALEIQSVDYTTEFDGEDWFGDLDDEGVYNEQMYLINAANDCTIELRGMPAVADEYEITINPGWNWIGFPSAVAIDVVDALSDFDAAEGDEIQDVDNTTEFDGEEWFGDLETLVPGKGLLYNNTSEEVKTLVFSRGAKKAARHANHNFGTPKFNVKAKSTKGNRTK